MTSVAAAHTRPEPLRRALRCAFIAALIVIGVLVLVFGVFPTRTWLQQRADADRAREQLAVLDAQNDVLEDRIDDLQTDAEIERLARQWYALVRPGEEAYAVLPSPRAAIDLPAIWPFGALVDDPNADQAAAGAPVDE